MNNTIIELADVSLMFDAKEVLSGITFSIRQGETFGLTGPSGGGQTYLLKLCAGLLRPTRGTVRRNLPPGGASGTGAGFVFESGGLLSNLTVFDNVALPLRYHTTMSEEEISAKVRAILTQLGIAEYSDVRPAPLRLGTRKLASLARAIAMQPRIIYYDEPELGLDRVARQIVETTLRERREQGVTSLVVSQDSEFVKKVADRAVLIVKGRIAGFWPDDGGNPDVRMFFSWKAGAGGGG